MSNQETIKCSICGGNVPLSKALWAGPAWGTHLTPETQQKHHRHFPIGGFVAVGHEKCLAPYIQAMMALLSGLDAFKTTFGFPDLTKKGVINHE